MQCEQWKKPSLDSSFELSPFRLLPASMRTLQPPRVRRHSHLLSAIGAGKVTNEKTAAAVVVLMEYFH